MKKILLFGEPLIRFTPSNYDSIGNSVLSQMYYGGSEINIARNLQGLQIETKIFTGLPKNPVGESFADFLNKNQIDTSSISWVGDRVGIYYLENGYGCRQSEVYYDRKHTSIQDINIDSLDIDEILKDITHFHFSGITVAVSQKVRDILLLLLSEAKKRNITISMDLNLRTKMICIQDAKIEFSRFAHYADYCFGIEPLMLHSADFDMFDRENASHKDIKNRMKALKELYGFKVIFHTVRSTTLNGNNTYSGYAFGEDFVESVILETPILERVGSGDAFVAGALYKLMQNVPLKDTLNFAVASGTYKCTLNGDNMFVSADCIEKLLSNHRDIIR